MHGGEFWIPLKRGRSPGIIGGNCASGEAVDEIDEKRQLRDCEEDCRVGDVALERQGRGEEIASGLTRDSGELGVVAGFSGKAGDVHGEEGSVGTEDGSPEVDLAEGLGHEARGAGCNGGDLGKPVVRCGEEAEDAGHGHDEVEVGDDKEGVVEVLVENWLGEDGAGKASGDKEGDEAEGEEHRRGVLGLRTPDGG